MNKKFRTFPFSSTNLIFIRCYETLNCSVYNCTSFSQWFLGQRSVGDVQLLSRLHFIPSAHLELISFIYTPR